MTNPIVQELIDKTYRELNASQKPQTQSRISKTPNGYIFLISWSNAHLLRLLVRLFTDNLPKSEYRLKNQLNDSARSVIANIEEGFGRPTTIEYLNFLGFSEGSLIEIKGDIQRSLQDNFIKSVPQSNLLNIKINLIDWHNLLKQSVISHKENYGNLRETNTSQNKSPLNSFNLPLNSPNSPPAVNPLASLKFLYLPLKNLQADNLTYEIFIELINKTDWNLRKLVESLEIKLNRDQKYYQVEKLRTLGKVTWRK